MVQDLSERILTRSYLHLYNLYRATDLAVSTLKGEAVREQGGRGASPKEGKSKSTLSRE